jgi:hypothetical protein
MKELVQRVDDNEENNKELQKKLFEENEKHDTLLNDLTDRQETFRLTGVTNDETEKLMEVQKEELDRRKLENDQN